MSRSLLVFVFDADPDIPELIELLQSKYGAVTATRFEFESPVVVVPSWWERLPKDSRLRVIKDTIIWYNTARSSKHSDKKAGDETMTYWGRHEHGMLCVLDKPAMKLWVSASDVEPIV